MVTPSLVAMREPSGPMTEARVEVGVALAQTVSLEPRYAYVSVLLVVRVLIRPRASKLKVALLAPTVRLRRRAARSYA